MAGNLEGAAYLSETRYWFHNDSTGFDWGEVQRLHYLKADSSDILYMNPSYIAMGFT